MEENTDRAQAGGRYGASGIENGRRQQRGSVVGRIALHPHVGVDDHGQLQPEHEGRQAPNEMKTAVKKKKGSKPEGEELDSEARVEDET